MTLPFSSVVRSLRYSFSFSFFCFLCLDMLSMMENSFRFAAALKGLKVWVMNVVPIDSPDTLPIIYERGLFGMYHDWCQSFNTYPRSYDLLHADHLFSSLKKRFIILYITFLMSYSHTSTQFSYDWSD
jgi:hypothetical protein